ncbi:metal ABC transporter permease [Plastorhodobacter daqingensis]|uniref:Metal ABC transporter permease n=1 Tax=Plastorhodobacter daqingensis TaxID=1387281 RepID=A0ABW2UJU8_9RHOB
MLTWFFNDVAAMIVATGALVGAGSALLGVFLVLRGAGMLTHAISHSILLGIVIAWMLSGQTSGPFVLAAAALAGLLSVVMTEALARSNLVRMDAAIGLVFPALFALGVLLISLNARNVHLDEHAVLLGEIGFVWLDTVQLGGHGVPRAMLAVGTLTLLNLLFVTLFYKELKLASFDAALAHALGFAPGILFYALLGLTSATAVASFDAVGVVLFLAFVIVPPSAALLLTDRLWLVILLSVLMAVGSSLAGYLLAVRWNVSIGGMMALMTGLCLVAALLAGPRHGVIARQLRQRGQRAENDARSLVAHLYNHEAGPEAAEENTVRALHDHLLWSEAQARRVILHGLDRGLVERRGEALHLTPKGRAVAFQIFEPWRRGDEAEAAQEIRG